MKFKKSLIALLLVMSTFLFSACAMMDDDTSSTPDSSQEDTSGEEWGDGNDYTGDHVDADENGVCDKCNESVVVTFDVFAINDLHGKFFATGAQPGVDKMSTYIKNARAQNPNTILLSSGDMWQGSPESNLTKGNVITEWMNEMEFASMTLGNHEYDWGEAAIAANAELANFPFLGVNVFDRETNELAAYCKPSVMVEKNGVKVGIIGAEGNVHSSISADKGEGVTFEVGNRLTQLVMQESERLRSLGADCIIYSLHDGTTEDYDHYDEVLSKDGYVDIVFEAHTHARYVTQDEYGVYHVQGGGDNSSGIAHAEIAVNYVNATASVPTAPKQIYHTDYASLTGDPIVNTLNAKYEKEIAPMHEVLGVNAARKEKAELCNVSAQNYYEAGAKKWADKPIVLGGGFMNIRAPGYLKAGVVIYGDLINLMPFDNELVLATVKGSKLLEKFINNKSYYLYYSDYGKTLKEDSSLIQFNEDYYVIVDRYTSTYASNGMTEIEWYDTTTFQRDLYAEYLKKTLPQAETKPKTVSIAEAYSIANGLEKGAETTEKYRTWGKIKEIANATYGQCTIEDGNGNEIVVYGLYGKGGEQFSTWTTKPVVGDTIVIEGTLKKYVGKDGVTITPEFGKATLLGHTARTLTSITTINGTIADSVGDGEETTEKYCVIAKITDLQNTEYGNCYVQDLDGNQLYVYGIRGTNNEKYDTLSDKPTVGDIVLLEGIIKRFKGTLEMFNATLLDKA